MATHSDFPGVWGRGAGLGLRMRVVRTAAFELQGFRTARHGGGSAAAVG